MVVTYIRIALNLYTYIYEHYPKRYCSIHGCNCNDIMSVNIIVCNFRRWIYHFILLIFIVHINYYIILCYIYILLWLVVATCAFTTWANNTPDNVSSLICSDRYVRDWKFVLYILHAMAFGIIVYRVIQQAFSLSMFSFNILDLFKLWDLGLLNIPNYSKIKFSNSWDFFVLTAGFSNEFMSIPHSKFKGVVFQILQWFY